MAGPTTNRLAAPALLLALILSGCAAPRPGAAFYERDYRDWRIRCPMADVHSCELVQDVWRNEDRTEIAQLIILRDKGTDMLTVMLPYNVRLESGMALAFDKAKPLVFEFDNCGTVGCIARIPFTGDLAHDFARVEKPRVLFAGLDGKVFEVPYSMAGFAEAFQAFQNRVGTAP